MPQIRVTTPQNPAALSKKFDDAFAILSKKEQPMIIGFGCQLFFGHYTFAI